VSYEAVTPPLRWATGPSLPINSFEDAAPLGPDRPLLGTDACLWAGMTPRNLESPSKVRRRRGSVGRLTSAAVLPALLGVITGPMAARALGPAGRGQAAAAVVYGFALPVFLSLGVTTAIGQRAALEPDRRSSLVTTSIVYALLTVPATAVALVLIMDGPLRSIHGSARIMSELTLGSAPLGVLAAGFLAILQSEGALGSLARIRATPFLINFVLTVGLFFDGRLTVATYLVTSLIAGVGALALTICALRDRPRGYYPLRPLLGFGLRGFAGTVANMANARLDQLIMVPFLGSAPLGLYAVGVSMASMPAATGVAIASRSYGQIATATDPRAETARYLRMTFLTMFGASLAFAVLGPIAIPVVFGPAFRGAVVPMWWLLPGTIALGVAAVCTGALQVFDRPGCPSWAEVSGATVTVGGLALFLRPMGIAGAAIVSTVAYSVTMGLQLWWLRRLGVRGLVPGKEDLVWLARRALPRCLARMLAWFR
jgi:O-antigen/teichoic acid export membrane protein